MENFTKAELNILSNTRKKVGKALHQFELLQPDDHVLVGVSGGKDSLFLLEALAMQKKSIPFDFKISAMHVQVTDADYKVNLDFIESLCAELEVPLYYVDIELGDLEAQEKSPCFICSWKRRKTMFTLAKELECNKIALGHHMDDAIETLLLNMNFHANISALPPKVYMLKDDVNIIRPLLLVEEAQIETYVKLRGFPDEIELCQFEDRGKRLEMKKIVNQLASVNKNARINLFRSMSNIDLDYLPK